MFGTAKWKFLGGNWNGISYKAKLQSRVFLETQNLLAPPWNMN
jgi:hypothetical protein